MKNFLLSILCLFSVVAVQAQETVTDILTRDFFGVTGTSYVDVNATSETSKVNYDGQMAGGNNSIQLRSSNSNSGIVTTNSVGVVNKVTVTWNSNTTSGRTLDVYGSNTAYTNPSQLYDSKTQGTKLGSIVYGTSTQLEITGDYAYIGLRSKSGAMYLTNIHIEWDTSVPVDETVVAPVITAESEKFENSMSVTITSATEGATIYYTLNGGEEQTAETNPCTITIEETTEIKAWAKKDGMNDSAETTATFTKVEPVKGYYVKVTSLDDIDESSKYIIAYVDGSNAYIFNATDAVNGYVSAIAEGTVIFANSEIADEEITFETMAGGYAVKTRKGYVYGDSGSNKLSFNSTTQQLNVVSFEEEDGSLNLLSGRYLQFNYASNQLRFRYYTKGNQGKIYLYKYTEETDSHTLAVSSVGYATLYLGFNAAIPAGAKAYIIKEVTGEKAMLTEVTGVLPENTGVIVTAEEGEYVFKASDETPANVDGNLLKGTVVAENIDAVNGTTYYVLANVDGIGLYPAQINDGKFYNNANKAYLPYSGAAFSAGFHFDFGTTGIESVEAVVENNVYYDLSGRRVENPVKGLYIVNGKKVLVK